MISYKIRLNSQFLRVSNFLASHLIYLESIAAICKIRHSLSKHSQVSFKTEYCLHGRYSKSAKNIHENQGKTAQRLIWFDLIQPFGWWLPALLLQHILNPRVSKISFCEIIFKRAYNSRGQQPHKSEIVDIRKEFNSFRIRVWDTKMAAVLLC